MLIEPVFPFPDLSAQTLLAPTLREIDIFPNLPLICGCHRWIVGSNWGVGREAWWVIGGLATSGISFRHPQVGNKTKFQRWEGTKQNAVFLLYKHLISSVPGMVWNEKKRWPLGWLEQRPARESYWSTTTKTFFSSMWMHRVFIKTEGYPIFLFSSMRFNFQPNLSIFIHHFSTNHWKAVVHETLS